MYRPEYCDLVIEDMAQGYSLTAFAGRLRVSRETIYEWMKQHVEFSDAVNRARPARTRAGENMLLHAEKGAEAAAAIFLLKNADPVEWKEVREVKHAHTMKLQQLTDEELHALIREKAGQQGDVIDGDFTRTHEG